MQSMHTFPYFSYPGHKGVLFSFVSNELELTNEKEDLVTSLFLSLTFVYPAK